MKLSDLNVSAFRKVCVLGDPGTGKSIFASTFPGPIKLYDFDMGKSASSMAAFHRTNAGKLDGIDFFDCSRKPGEARNAGFMRFQDDFTKLETTAKAADFPFKTVVIDSSTLWTEAMFDHLMAANPGIQRPKTQLAQVTAMQDYQIFAPYCGDWLARLLSLPCHVVMTGHYSIEKNELTGEIMRSPSLPGKKAPEKIGIMFQEVYRMYVETAADGKRKYMAQTVPDHQYKAIRSQIPGLPAKVEAHFDSLNKSWT